MNPPGNDKTQRYCDSKLLRRGLALLVIGTGPLLCVMAAAKLGMTHDPNPNPVGFGILAGLTLWPAVIMIVVGVITVRGANKRP